MSNRSKRSKRKILQKQIHNLRRSQSSNQNLRRKSPQRHQRSSQLIQRPKKHPLSKIQREKLRLSKSQLRMSARKSL